MSSNLSIKKWIGEERPREKLIHNGAASLSVPELLAILIRTGHSEGNAVETSRQLLLSAENSLKNLSKFSIEKMCDTNGVGVVKAISIIAAFELASRLASEIPEEMPTISSSGSVVKIIAPYIKNLDYEECWVLYLNRANKLIFKEKISKGGINATIIDIRLIIKRAIEKLASAIIMVHNHPSGNPIPGEQDKKQTKILKDAASMLDISLLDHIIIAGNNFYSFSDEGINIK